VSALACTGLEHDYPGPLRAVDGVDLALAEGELVAVIGPNGSGKSTLLRCLAGLLKPSAGSVSLAGRPLAGLDERARARHIAVVPQFLPALHDIAVGDFVLGGRYAHFGRWSGPGPDDRGVVRCALEAADVLDLEQRLMSELSGGQRQRVLVARAIAQEAGVLLVDEPTSSLDPEHQVQVFELIARAVADARAALVVTHDLNLAAQFATRVVLLDAGRVAADGPPAEVVTPAVLNPVYGDSLRFGTLPDGAGGQRPFAVPWRPDRG
jgi:iron complex transport system ATP-binding protein